MRPASRDDPTEQRRFSRVLPLATQPVEVHIMGDGFLEVVHARDISVGGVRVEVKHGFSKRAMSEQVDLVLVLPRMKPFSARGVIRHLRGGGDRGVFGVQFVELAEEARAVIDRYVEAMIARGRRC